jgi:hypothetical protein
MALAIRHRLAVLEDTARSNMYAASYYRNGYREEMYGHLAHTKENRPFK